MRDIPHSPVALYEVAQSVWTSHRGNHLGQRSCGSAQTGRTYGRKRSDQRNCETSCEEGAVRIWNVTYRPSPCCMDRWCGRTEPDPCSGSCDADVLRASQIQHSVQNISR